MLLRLALSKSIGYACYYGNSKMNIEVEIVFFY